MKNTKGDLCAICSQFLLHVDLNSRKSCLPMEPIAAVLEKLDKVPL